MSNHSGSYMLNTVLTVLDEDYKFFEGKSQEEILQIFKDFAQIGRHYDCNTGEILEYIGEKYNVCYYCMSISDDIEDGCCRVCRGE